MRSLVFTLLLVTVPSYAECYDHYELTSECQEELQDFRERGLRPPRSVIRGARWERYQEQRKTGRIEALEELRDGIDTDMDFMDTPGDDHEVKESRRELREKLAEKLQQKIDSIEYGFE